MSDWLEIMRHTIGADPYGRIRHDRNYFITGEGGKDWLTCVDLVSAGYMTSRKGNAATGGDDIFFATRAGREFVQLNREPMPEPPKRTRYDEYRDSEVCESFGEWLCGYRLPEFETRREFKRDPSRPDINDLVWVTEHRMFRRDRWAREVEGKWMPTKKEAKASYKAALKARSKR